ncbi:MAG: hypothetical protein V1659_00950, partial [Candidatus Woesearchaeota archaeon]
MNNLYFKLDCLTKLFGYVNAVTGEVSGMGLVEKIKDMFVVTEIFLLKQECSYSTTEIDSEDLGKLMLELTRQGKEGSLKLWWHSHGSMNAFWSTTDKHTARILSGSNWMFTAVVNKEGKIKISLDVSIPFHHVADDIQVSIYDPDTSRIFEICKKEVKEKVKEEKISNGKQREMFDDLELCPVCHNIILNNEKQCPECRHKIRRNGHETHVSGKKRIGKCRKRKLPTNIQDR